MAPLLPGLSDDRRQIERVVVAAREAGACGIWANLLHLRPGTREHFLTCLQRDWPELLSEYEELYAHGASVPTAVSAPTRELVRSLARERGIRDRRTRKPHPPARAEQLSLL